MRRRALLLVAPLLLGACGIIAGLDGYELDQSSATGDASADASSSVDGEVSVATDAGQSPKYIVDGDTMDEPPPPPPLDAAKLSDGCPPSGENNASCSAGATCCGQSCMETHRCINNCKQEGTSCGKSQCCVGTYCPYYNLGATCTACLPKDTPVPIVNFNAFDQACCSNADYDDYATLTIRCK